MNIFLSIHYNICFETVLLSTHKLWATTYVWAEKKCVCFVALRPKSTAMVMAGQSVHLTTLLFLGKLEQAVNQYFVHILSIVTDNNPS